MYLGKLVELARSKDLYRAPRHPYTGALLSAVPIANPRLGRESQRLRPQGRRPQPDQPAERVPLPSALPARAGDVRAGRPAARRGGGGARGGMLLPAREVAADRRRDVPCGHATRAGRRLPDGGGAGRRPVGVVIVRGLRDLSLGLVAVCGLTAVASLLVGLAAGLPAARAVSGGLMLVGSLLFTAGAVVGLRDPARSRERRAATGASSSGPATWGGGLPPLRLARRLRALPRPPRCGRQPADDGLMEAWAHPGPKSACDDARLRASLALDGALDDVGLARLRSHLDACPSCARFVVEMGSVVSLLRGAPLEAFRCELAGSRVAPLVHVAGGPRLGGRGRRRPRARSRDGVAPGRVGSDASAEARRSRPLRRHGTP